MVSISFPRRCESDYVAVYRGSSLESPFQTLCGYKQRQDFLLKGESEVLVEFRCFIKPLHGGNYRPSPVSRSGPAGPPFHYNGFSAKIEFFDGDDEGEDDDGDVADGSRKERRNRRKKKRRRNKGRKRNNNNNGDEEEADRDWDYEQDQAPINGEGGNYTKYGSKKKHAKDGKKRLSR